MLGFLPPAEVERSDTELAEDTEELLIESNVGRSEKLVIDFNSCPFSTFEGLSVPNRSLDESNDFSYFPCSIEESGGCGRLEAICDDLKAGASVVLAETDVGTGAFREGFGGTGGGVDIFFTRRTQRIKKNPVEESVMLTKKEFLLNFSAIAFKSSKDDTHDFLVFF